MEITRLNKLSNSVIGKIAAGEVIERPSSVLKELIENSLDASATEINIEIRGDGLGLIKVTDNGSGICKKDIALSIEPHATSKIRKADDLLSINTFGFRGEALASISSVSKIKISTNNSSDELGMLLSSIGSQQVSINNIDCMKGTIIEVSDLFFNTPVRKKFLSSPKTEVNHIDSIIKRFIISNNKVRFVVKYNERNPICYPISNNEIQISKRVEKILGNKFIQNSVRLDYTNHDLELKGFLGNEKVCRRQTDQQYFYINNRFIKDKVINHAIKQALDGYIPEDYCPTFILFLSMDPKLVDINVHPAKTEVRFQEPRYIHDFIFSCVQKTIINFENSNGYEENNITPKRELYVRERIQESTRDDVEKDFVKIIYGEKHYRLINNADNLYIYNINILKKVVLRNNYEINKNKSIPIMIPKNIPCSISQAESLKKIVPYLNNNSFDIDDLGNNNFIIRMIPKWMKSEHLVECLKLTIDGLKSKDIIEEIFENYMAISEFNEYQLYNEYVNLGNLQVYKGLCVWEKIDEELLDKLFKYNDK